MGPPLPSKAIVNVSIRSRVDNKISERSYMCVEAPWEGGLVLWVPSNQLPSFLPSAKAMQNSNPDPYVLLLLAHSYVTMLVGALV